MKCKQSESRESRRNNFQTEFNVTSTPLAFPLTEEERDRIITNCHDYPGSSYPLDGLMTLDRVPNRLRCPRPTF
jgi:hypothetical protein